MTGRPAAANLGLLLSSTLLTLLAAEAGLRWLLPPPPMVRVLHETDLDHHLEEEKQEAREIALGPEGGWKDTFIKTPSGRRMRANMRVQITNHGLSGRTFEIRTNSLGYRSPEIGPKTRTRVLCLGDSITMGHYLPEEETFVRRAEKLSEATSRPLEMINAGIAAAGLQSEVAILEETGLRTDPDVVLVNFYLNDVHASPGIYVQRPPEVLAWSRLAQYAAIAAARLGPADEGGEARIDPNELEAWRSDTARRYPPGPGDPQREPAALHRLVLDNFKDWGSSWSEGAWRKMRPYFLELDRQAKLHRFRLAFVIFPVEPQVESEFLEDVPQAALKRIAGEIDAPVLDLLPVLRKARAASTGSLFYDVCHPTPPTLALIAVAVHEFLQGTVLGPPAPTLPQR